MKYAITKGLLLPAGISLAAVLVASCSGGDARSLLGDGTESGGAGGSSSSASSGGAGGASGSSSSSSSSGAGGSTTGPCLVNSDCNDKNICTKDSCVSSMCAHDPISPDDFDACTVDTCDPATGVSHAPVQVDDNDVCTTDICDPNAGVLHMPNSCNDNDPCTADSCDAAKGCVHVPGMPDDGDACTIDTCDPVKGPVHTPKPVDDGDPCTADACDPATGVVSHTPDPCDDNNACTVDSCVPGAGCMHSTSTYFTEDFASNAKGWTLDTGWQIGAAKASSGQSNGFGTDPAQDHTPTADNGIAGTFIGGNIPKQNIGFQYITSPAIDLSNVNTPVFLEFWRVLNSDYPPYMDSNVQAFDGATNMWVTLYSVPGNNGNGPAIQENTQASPGWKKLSYDVSAYKGASFKIRFGYTIIDSGKVYTVGGWNIDDIRLVAGQNCP